MSILPRVTRILIIASLAVAFWGYLPESIQLQTVKPGEQVVPQDTVITLERTGCYGNCPIYKLTILADRTVVFEGERFVKKLGIAKSVISQKEHQELLAAFEKINYFQLRDRYERPEDGCKEWMTDHPSAITSITLNGKSKSVRHYSGCRGVDELAGLQKLEQAIDDAGNSSQWIR